MALPVVELPKASHPLSRLAIAGPMCSGKTYLAEILQDNYGYQIFRFAGKLKQVAADLYGPIEKDDAGRALLQGLGDDLKKWNPALFTEHLLLKINAHLRTYGPDAKIVVDDMRFMHEYNSLKSSGFTVIGLQVDDAVRMGRVLRLYPDTTLERFAHPSETGWRDMQADFSLANNGYEGVQALRDLVA